MFTERKDLLLRCYRFKHDWCHSKYTNWKRCQSCAWLHCTLLCNQYISKGTPCESQYHLVNSFLVFLPWQLLVTSNHNNLLATKTFLPSCNKFHATNSQQTPANTHQLLRLVNIHFSLVASGCWLVSMPVELGPYLSQSNATTFSQYPHLPCEYLVEMFKSCIILFDWTPIQGIRHLTCNDSWE